MDDQRIYFVRQFQLTVQSGCNLNSLLVVISSSLRRAAITEFHEVHTSIVKIKSVARMYVWWPIIIQEIVSYTSECQYYQLFKKILP